MSSAIDRLQLALKGFRQAVAERHLGLEGLHISLNGRGELTHRWVSDDRRDVYSVSKTFTSVAVGIAQAEGLLELDDPVLRHLPQFSSAAAAGVEAMTVRHLLSMTAGNGYRWLDPDADHPDDPARDFLSTRLLAEPGTAYHYRGGNSYVLGRIIHAASGLDLRDYLLPRLFRPLQIANPQWHRCPLGYPLGAVGLFLRTEEIARLGETLLNGGSFKGQQLIPADYVAEMRSQTTSTGRLEPDNQTYGLHAWLCSRDDAWRMDGIYGQFAIMLPHHDACITVTAHYEGPTTDILDTIWSELVPLLPD
jgi:CubicO group peptidase (beta-lactamase class C family)